MGYFSEQDIIRMCVDKLSDIYGTSVQLTNSGPVGGGCINHALKISTTLGDFFLKWNASAPVDMFCKEAACLTEMAQANSSLVIPGVIWDKESDDSPGLLLTEYLLSAGNTFGFD